MIKLYLMPRESVSEFTSISREIRSCSKGMTAEAMREGIAQIYASAKIYRAPVSSDSSGKLYEIDQAGAAHIPIFGMLTPQANPCAAMFGEAVTEYGYIIAACQDADADPAVASVIFEIDSGGGMVDGCDMAAQAMAAITKPTEARVENLAASAAYWLACMADKIIALTPSAQFGSIGVAYEEYDDDGALASEGIAHRVYTSTEAPDKRPDTKTPEGRAKIVSQLDELHQVFVGRVADGRKVSADKVRKDFGRGGLLIASTAMAAGMIDEIKGKAIIRNFAGVAGSAAQGASLSGTAISGKGVHMDSNQFKAENPDAYAAIKAEGVAEGIKAEQSRREKIVAFRGINDDGDKAVEDAIASGKAYEEVSPSIQAAVLRGKTAFADGENAPDFNARTPENGSGVSATDSEWYKAHGYSDEDIKKMTATSGKE